MVAKAGDPDDQFEFTHGYDGVLVGTPVRGHAGGGARIDVVGYGFAQNNAYFLNFWNYEGDLGALQASPTP